MQSFLCKAQVGVQGAKPPEADEFLHVKGGLIEIMIMNKLKKICEIFPKGGGGGGGGLCNQRRFVSCWKSNFRSVVDSKESVTSREWLKNQIQLFIVHVYI